MITGFWQKLGFWPDKNIKEWKHKKDWIWFHAVSVGELKAVWPLILEINKQRPHYPIMISITTKAGYYLANELTKEKNFLVIYFPFDFPNIISSLLNLAKIKLFIIVETEIWPNTLRECYKRKIPTILVNARISDKAFKNYLLLKFYFKNIVNLFSEVLAQSEKDANKFLKLGLNNNKVKVLGNIKFSSIINSMNGKKIISDIEGQNDLIKIIFASTHDEEEDIALSVYKKLILEFQNIRLIIAPRHLDRVQEISKLIKTYGFIPILKTENIKIKSSNEILILNTIGELNEYYKSTQITVLGGTFTKIGGHNILEPIRANSYTIIGPYDFKISELTSLFKIKHAIVQVKTQEELLNKIKEAILDKNSRESTIAIGKKIIEENANVLEKTTKQILCYL